MNASTQPKPSLGAYLAWKNEQPDKHEFHRFTCAEVDLAKDLIFRSPTVIFEVLSPTTSVTSAARSSRGTAASKRCASTSLSTPIPAASRPSASMDKASGCCTT